MDVSVFQLAVIVIGSIALGFACAVLMMLCLQYRVPRKRRRS